MLETKTVTNGPFAIQVQRVCHDTLPWLISVSLGCPSIDALPSRDWYDIGLVVSLLAFIELVVRWRDLDDPARGRKATWLGSRVEKDTKTGTLDKAEQCVGGVHYELLSQALV
jgi:hypothetical protein